MMPPRGCQLWAQPDIGAIRSLLIYATLPLVKATSLIASSFADGSITRPPQDQIEGHRRQRLLSDQVEAVVRVDVPPERRSKRLHRGMYDIGQGRFYWTGVNDRIDHGADGRRFANMNDRINCVPTDGANTKLSPAMVAAGEAVPM